MHPESFPSDFTYTETHCWVALAPHEIVLDRPIRTGLTPVATGGRHVVSVELPPVRSEVVAGAVCGVVNFADLTVATLHAPISGVVTIHNATAVADPNIMGEDAFRSGWLFAILPSARSSTTTLLTRALYTEQISATV